MLLTLSGKHLPPDAARWREYVIASRKRYERPAGVNDGNVAAAIQRGAAFLRRRLEKHGGVYGRTKETPPRYSVALSCLAVMALRAAGDRDEDGLLARVVDKAYAALAHRRNMLGRHWMERSNDCHLSFLILVMDPKSDAEKIRKLARALVEAQLTMGTWGRLGRWVIFTPNTLFALLALRLAERAGFEVPNRVWIRAASWWQSEHYPSPPPTERFVSRFHFGEVSAVVAGLSLCREHARPKRKEAALVELGIRLHDWGRKSLGRDQVGWVAFAVERACSLADVDVIVWDGRTTDWHEVGARGYLETQRASGCWPCGLDRCVDEEFTAFAILFLTRGSIGRTRSRTGRTLSLDDMR